MLPTFLPSPAPTEFHNMLIINEKAQELFQDTNMLVNVTGLLKITTAENKTGRLLMSTYLKTDRHISLQSNFKH